MNYSHELSCRLIRHAVTLSSYAVAANSASGGGAKSAIHDFFVDYDGLTVPRIPANDINK